jgi:hypothetical protein
VLYQSGVFTFSGREEFLLDFLRQFVATDDDGEYDHIEQLDCEFRFPVNDETRSFGRYEQWWFPDESQEWSDFVALVEQRPEFVALRSSRPHSAKVEQEKV